MRSKSVDHIIVVQRPLRLFRLLPAELFATRGTHPTVLLDFRSDVRRRCDGNDGLSFITQGHILQRSFADFGDAAVDHLMSFVVFELFWSKTFRLENGGVWDENLVFLILDDRHSRKGVQIWEMSVSVAGVKVSKRPTIRVGISFNHDDPPIFGQERRQSLGAGVAGIGCAEDDNSTHVFDCLMI
jgi:hypothetical protein